MHRFTARFDVFYNPGLPSQLKVRDFVSALCLGVFLTLIMSRPGLAQTVDSHNATKQPSVEWQKRSQATATWLWLDIYNATLFTQPGFELTHLLADKTPLKLELCYLKAISKEDLIEGAQAVLDKNLAPQLKQEVALLHQQYVDVKPGDCYALEYTLQDGTQLKLNGQRSFKSDQQGFKAVYFGIWLGQNPLSEDLKQSLLSPLQKPAEPLL